MGKTLAVCRVYRLQGGCISFYEAEFRKFFEFVRSITGRVDTEDTKTTRKEIDKTVYKPTRTNREITAESVKNTMNLFMANKQIGFCVTLEEIKKMTPQEGYLFSKQVMEAVKQIELEKLKH